MSEPTPAKALRALIVEDRADDAILITRALQRADYQVLQRRVETAIEFIAALDDHAWDVVLCDYHLPRFGVLEALQLLKDRALDIPLIVVTGVVGEDRAVTAMRAGAVDFVLKGNLARLAPAVARELRDVAERQARRTTRDELARRERRLQAVMDHIAEGLLLLDEHGMVITANLPAAQLFGASEESQLHQRPLTEHFIVPSELQLDAAPGLPCGEHGLIGIRAGTHFEAELVLSSVESDEVRWIAVVRDVSERNRLRLRVERQRALAHLGELAAIVAHEVKNPLAGIRGAVGVLGQRLPGDATAQEIIEEIRNRIDQLRHVVEDLLVFARPRAPRPGPVPVVAIIDDALALFAHDPSWTDVQVKVAPLVGDLAVDVQLVRDALVNLLQNAVEAGARQITIGGQELSGGIFRLEVRDDGPGIPAELLPRASEPFVTTKHRGSGLGLAIANNVAQSHGGRLELCCPASGGTIAALELPTAATDLMTTREEP
jgi:PAS domain S-box-containing protein